jgi:sterol 24-C-methyltransferase
MVAGARDPRTYPHSCVEGGRYQLRRLAAKVRSEGLERQCDGVKGDFMNLPFEANTFDAAYAIEATCHAPNRTLCFAQIFKVLKPGKIFAGCVGVID